MTLEVGAISENVTVTGQSPLIDTSNASTGGVLDRQTLEALPAPGRNAFLVGITVPTVMPVGDPQFNRQQDQTNASRVSLGGGGIRANNYLLDGVPITELRGPRGAQPDDGGDRRGEGAGAHLRRRDGPHRRRRLQRHRASPGRTTSTAAASIRRGRSGASRTTSSTRVAGETKEESGLADAYYRLYGGGVGGPIVKNRTFFWVAH